MYRFAQLVCVFSIAVLFASCGEKQTDQHLSEHNLALIRWQQESRRDAYCERDIDNGNMPFDQQRWYEGDSITRGAMAREMICGDMVYGLLREEVVENLGAGDLTEDPGLSGDELVYRVIRSRDFTKYPPPVPLRYREVPNTYEIHVLFDPATKRVIGFDVWPALESDS